MVKGLGFVANGFEVLGIKGLWVWGFGDMGLGFGG